MHKVAVITGGGGGIGRASAFLFANEGARVVVVDNKCVNGRDVVHTIVVNGGDAIFVEADVSKAEDVKRIFEVTKEKYGVLHILYNNVEICRRGVDGPVTEITVEAWNQILGVNLMGVFLCCKYGIPEIVRSGGGSVINVSSSAGVIGVPNCDAYTASKGAIIALTRSMAVEYAPRGVRVNCIVPCAVETPMLDESSRKDPSFDEKEFLSTTPLRRFGRPEEIANMALFLASDEASYAVGGVFVMDGGVTIT